MRWPIRAPFPAKTLGYAKYDFVRVLNQGLDTLGLRGSIVEHVLARTLAVPAARFFRMRRSVSLLVAERADGTTGIVEGTYQSPILVQWQHAPASVARAEHLAHRTSLVTLPAHLSPPPPNSSESISGVHLPAM